MQRPRLHINACICHGHEVLVTVSDADVPKDSNGTCDVIVHLLTRLRRKGVAVHRSRLYVQLDNTSSIGFTQRDMPRAVTKWWWLMHGPFRTQIGRMTGFTSGWTP